MKVNEKDEDDGIGFSSGSEGTISEDSDEDIKTIDN